jgi:hypothetical protein
MDTVRLRTILCKSTDTFASRRGADVRVTSWKALPGCSGSRSDAERLQSEKVANQGVGHCDNQSNHQPVAEAYAAQAFGDGSR